MNIDKLYAVEFSLSQKAFHVQPLMDAMENNVLNVMQRKQNDYQIVSIVANQEAANRFIEVVEEEFKNYGMYKTFTGQIIIME